jgi:hypothetical protein
VGLAVHRPYHAHVPTERIADGLHHSWSRVDDFSSHGQDARHRVLCGQTPFGQLAYRHVTNRSDDQEFPFCTYGIQVDFHRKGAATLAPAEDFQAGIKGSQPRAGEIGSAVRDMLAPQPFRHKDLDGLAEQFLPLVAEQLLCLGVDENDMASLINDDQGIGHGFKQIGKDRLQAPAVGEHVKTPLNWRVPNILTELSGTVWVQGQGRRSRRADRAPGRCRAGEGLAWR